MSDAQTRLLPLLPHDPCPMNLSEPGGEHVVDIHKNILQRLPNIVIMNNI